MFTRFLVFFTLCASALSAQATRHGPRPMPMPPPLRMVLADANLQPIELQQLDISTETSGGMAQTTVRMVFFNPNSRRLEGNLQFPLLDGQQVTDFALDINGAMRPAVPVAKDKGRQVFEAIERRQVDPGLLEVTQGNNFKLRVYPIQPRSTRTVELTYAEPMKRRGANWLYRLPMGYGKVGQLNLQVRVNDLGGAPVINSLGNDLAFSAAKSSYLANMARSNYQPPAEGIEVLIPIHDQPRVYHQELQGQTWFLAEIPVPLTRTRRVAPQVIGLLWDSSGSGSARAIEAELAELDTYFRTLGNVEVRLTRLRDRAEKQQQFHVVDGDWRTLRRALEDTVYDGASALNDWMPELSVDQYLLFSDGLSNYGGKRFPALSKNQRLFALNSSPSANSTRLTALAERSGGRYINISNAARGEAAQALLFSETTIDDISANGATDIEVESLSARDGMLRIAGRVVAPGAGATLTLRDGSRTRRLDLALTTRAQPHPRAGAAWAGYRLRTLEADRELNVGEIGRIGRRFGIPTSETSLIVLEEMSDYVRYEIEPPAKYAAEYKRLLQEQQDMRSARRNDHLGQVLRAFEARKAWWAKKYEPRVTPVKMKGGPLPVLAYAPAAAPPPAPVAEAVASADRRAMAQQRSLNETERVHVTGSRLAMRTSEGHSPTTVVGARGADSAIGIQLKKWVANAPYVERLQRASRRDAYRVYLDQKPDYVNSSAFYLDAADVLFEKGERELALRVLSNLSEMDLENRAVLRILGYRLLQAKAPELAVPVFEHVLRIAGEEPQSYRDLGLALAASGRHQEAIDNLYEVVVRPWDGRFADVEVIVLAEINALIATSRQKLDTSRIDPRLRANLPLDVRVVLTWDADNSDMDLFVTDPAGERAWYSNPLTAQGGKMSKDFTGGYGPEEFALRKAMPGKYKIEVNYFGNQQQVIAGATTLQVKMVTHFGLPQQKEQLISLRLKDKSETVFVGEFEVQ